MICGSLPGRDRRDASPGRGLDVLRMGCRSSRTTGRKRRLAALRRAPRLGPWRVVGTAIGGRNLARNVAESPEPNLAGPCERDTQRGVGFKQRFLVSAVRQELDDVLDDLVSTRHRRHALVTHHARSSSARWRPATRPRRRSRGPPPRPTRKARQRSPSARTWAPTPGHTFVYTPAVKTIRALLTEGVIGDVYFVTSAARSWARTSATAWSSPSRRSLSISCTGLTSGSRRRHVGLDGVPAGRPRLPSSCRPSPAASPPDIRSWLCAQGPPDGDRRSKRMASVRRDGLRRACPRTPRHGTWSQRGARRQLLGEKNSAHVLLR